MDPKVEEAKKQYGRLALVVDGEKTFCFRPATREEISSMRKSMGKDSTGVQALAILTTFCASLCVVGKDGFAAYAADYPLRIAGGSEDDDASITDAIMNMARGEAEITVI